MTFEELPIPKYFSSERNAGLDGHHESTARLAQGLITGISETHDDVESAVQRLCAELLDMTCGLQERVEEEWDCPDELRESWASVLDLTTVLAELAAR